MAIGDTVQAGLMRVDPSAILEAGRVKGQLGQQIGQTLGGLATTYFDTKKRAKESEGQIKGVSMALKTLAKADDGFADLYEAQDARINDPEIPLSQRRAEALSFMQNLGVTQKVRSAQIADQATRASMKISEENQELKKEQAIFDRVIKQLNIAEDVFSLAESIRKSDEDKKMRLVYTPEMEGKQKIAEKQITEAKASQEVQPVFDASGRPMPNLLRIGNQLLQRDDTGRVARLGTAIENVVDVDRTPIATPTIKMVDPERGFRGTIGRQIEDAIQSAARYVGIGTLPDTILEGGKEKLTASQRITTIGRTLEPLLMKTFGGKMTDYQIKRIEQSIPLSSDDPEEGMAKMTETVGLLRDQLNRANDAIGTLNPKTEAFAEAMSTKKGIEANLPIIEEIVNRYYGNIPSDGSMGSLSDVDALLQSEELLQSLPRDTNKTNSNISPLDILAR
jgi:hypothetical protein